ncbi:MAG: TIGR02996 domain-containing protein, partial [Gemmataceae bacterium]|nr:TIGR02996 domain-containing protein [Gemmataceae bacterium]
MQEPPEERGLIEGIVEAPDEDAPRLIYADWLEDHGQPEHAEFIRAQVALPGLAADDERLLPLLRRSARLERRLRERTHRGIPKWAATAGSLLHLLDDQPPHAVPGWADCWRGFPVGAFGQAHEWMTRGGPVLDRVPLRGLSLVVGEAADELGDWPGLERLRALSLDLDGVGPT